MHNRHLLVVVLPVVLLLTLCRSAESQFRNPPFAVHVLIDGASHSVYYTVGKEVRRYRSNKEFFDLLGKMHTDSPARPFLFLISDTLPIRGISGLFLVVDKFGLGPTRYFVTAKDANAMNEITRNQNGGFTITTPSVLISDNPN